MSRFPGGAASPGFLPAASGGETPPWWPRASPLRDIAHGGITTRHDRRPSNPVDPSSLLRRPTPEPMPVSRTSTGRSWRRTSKSAEDATAAPASRRGSGAAAAAADGLPPVVSVVAVDNDLSAAAMAAAACPDDNASDDQPEAYGTDSSYMYEKEQMFDESGQSPPLSHPPRHPACPSSSSWRRASSSHLSGTSSHYFTLLHDWVWLPLRHFIDSSFKDKDKERSFRAEKWYSDKRSALVGSLLLLIFWILSITLYSGYSTEIYISYLAVAGVFTLPVPVLVLLDGYLRFDWLYQPAVFCAVWVWGFVLTWQMFDCDYFGSSHCGPQTFVGLFACLMGLPTIAVIAMRQNRMLNLVGPVAWVITAGVLFYGSEYNRPPRPFTRNLVLLILYHLFLAITAYYRDWTDRQLFTLRQKLRTQYRAVHAAQMMERQAEDSKRRFVSYIFHEVRVPLNTALLAVQNLEGEGVFAGMGTDQVDMLQGLMGSLKMMEKVLNDVLSFNRMESGNLELVQQPFDLHEVIRTVVVNHKSSAETAVLPLLMELDPGIDGLGGLFDGDEMRLAQVMSNLVSNAIKFTASGSVRVVTKLLYPTASHSVAERMNGMESAPELAARDSTSRARRPSVPITDIEKGSLQAEDARSAAGARRSHELDQCVSRMTSATARPGRPSHALPLMSPSYPSAKAASALPGLAASGSGCPERDPPQAGSGTAVVRVEVHDTGTGLHEEDVAENRLFSPYVQTELGLQQGSKGSGLGLALVLQIIKLMRGRLGLDSQLGRGSTFWFEIPLQITAPDGAPVGVGGCGRESTSTTPRTTAPRPGLKAIQQRPWRAASQLALQPPAPAVCKNPSVASSALTRTTSRDKPPVTAVPAGCAPFPGRGPDTQHSDEKAAVAGPLRALLVPGRGHTHPGLVPELRHTLRHPLACCLPDTAARGRASNSAGLENESPCAESRNAASLGREDGPLSILIVDDDSLTRRLMTRMITRLGHDVTAADNGRAALELVCGALENRGGTPQFDVAFMDNQMPHMSGVEAVRAARKAGCTLFIVGCTGNALLEDQEEYLAAGADALVTKPVHQDMIVLQLEEAKRRRRQR